MATLTRVAESPGQGGRGAPAFWGGPRHVVIRAYTFDFDSSYPTGGEDISGIFNDFAAGGLLQILTNGAQADATNGRFIKVDYTNKKLMDYTALGTQATDTSDQSTQTGIRLIAIGYPA